jgi:hypothetical protein
VGPAARTRTQINRRGRRERRGEQKGGQEDGIVFPPRPQRSPRLNLPYHAPCGDPERCVEPAARTRTQVNRRGREERRVEQKRDVLIDAPLRALSALCGQIRPITCAAATRSDAWNRRQEQERTINRRGRKGRRVEQGSAVLTGCFPLRPQRSQRLNLPYHARCGDPERCVGPAARTRTRNQPQRPQRAQRRTGEPCPH